MKQKTGSTLTAWLLRVQRHPPPRGRIVPVKCENTKCCRGGQPLLIYALSAGEPRDVMSVCDFPHMCADCPDSTEGLTQFVPCLMCGAGRGRTLDENTL